MPTDLIRKVPMFRMEFWDVTLERAVASIMALRLNWDGVSFPYVLTANTDILVVMERKREADPDFYQAMSGAPIILADGFPVVQASRLFGSGLGQRVTGSDLFPALLDASRKARFLMIGPDIQTMEQLQLRFERETDNEMRSFVAPKISVREGLYQDYLEKILGETYRFCPDYIICFLGFPKAEYFLLDLFRRLRKNDNCPVPGFIMPVFLSLGAAASFYAGTRKRAPKWVQRFGFEWMYRLLQEPGRLLRRYTKGAVLFPLITYRSWKYQRNGKRRESAGC